MSLLNVSLEPCDGVFLVQGTLSAPLQVVIRDSTSPTGLRELSWSPPFTIDLTDQDPDILGYKLCFTVSLPSQRSLTETPQCRITESVTYSFTNVRLAVNFSIAAINPAGEGASVFMVHQACSDGE